MPSVFIIAECGSSWRFCKSGCKEIGPKADRLCHLDNAYRMIEAAKSCGADAVKFQWCSSAKELASRRGEPQYEKDYEYVVYDREWLPMLKEKADKVGIEWMCTAFLPQDVSVIAPLVKRFKVAAKEAGDEELRDAILSETIRPIYVSFNGATNWAWNYRPADGAKIAFELHCVSKYPCPIDEIKLGTINDGLDGLSDHTGHVLTGAVAVGAGAKVIESHVRLEETPTDNPDWPHSLIVDQKHRRDEAYYTYVQNIRTAERMVG